MSLWVSIVLAAWLSRSTEEDVDDPDAIGAVDFPLLAISGHGGTGGRPCIMDLSEFAMEMAFELQRD
jgi:hypothetical protein